MTAKYHTRLDYTVDQLFYGRTRYDKSSNQFIELDGLNGWAIPSDCVAIHVYDFGKRNSIPVAVWYEMPVVDYDHPCSGESCRVEFGIAGGGSLHSPDQIPDYRTLVRMAEITFAYTQNDPTTCNVDTEQAAYLDRLASAALPTDDDDDGSERQLAAENEFYQFARSLFNQKLWDAVVAYGEGSASTGSATSEECIAYCRDIARGFLVSPKQNDTLLGVIPSEHPVTVFVPESAYDDIYDDRDMLAIDFHATPNSVVAECQQTGHRVESHDAIDAFDELMRKILAG